MAENDVRLGGLYDKGLASGEENGFLVGRIIMDKDYAEGEELRIVIFTNNYKEREEHPDFTILKARPRKDEEATKKTFGQNKFKKPGPQAPAQHKPEPPKQFKPGVKPSKFGKK